MNVTVLKLLLPAVLFFVSSNSVLAYTKYATSSATVTAEVISPTFNPPIISAPQNNSTTSNTREPLVWQRPSPLPATPLHHYDVYLDGEIFASSISDSITSQTYYYYSVYRQNNTFTLYLSSDLSQGYHTWRVVAYNTYGTNASSDTVTFYVDSVSPQIKLTKVDRQTLNWDTTNPSSIPDINHRGLSVTNANPLLTGAVEPYANMQIVLMCPQNILNCHNQTWQGNYPSGTWQHRFYNLIKGAIYTVYISATDASGNSTIFPEFYLAYGVKTPIPIVTPVPPITPIQFPSTITPEITPTPTPFIPQPPVSPTPPVFEFMPTTPVQRLAFPTLIFLLLAFGLPLHLLMTIIGAKITFANIPQFLYVLFLPFFGQKTYQTVPFTTLYFYDPENLDHAWEKAISDIRGFYTLKRSQLNEYFVELTATARNWKNSLIPRVILPIICLYPQKSDHPKGIERVRRSFMKLRIIPLVIACLTSTYCLLYQPGYFFLIYLYLSLHLVFAEYIYPHLSKD